MKLSSEFQGFCTLEFVMLSTIGFPYTIIQIYFNIKNFIINTSKVRKRFKYSRNIPVLLSYLSYNFSYCHENGPVIISLSWINCNYLQTRTNLCPQVALK